MGHRGLLIFLATFAISACAGLGIDRPVLVEADYATREAAAMVASDRCGPSSITEVLPTGLIRTVGTLTDGPFSPVCARHDACYRLGEKTQTWCDDRMRQEMTAICDSGEATPAYSAPVIGPALCRFHGGLYYSAINSTWSAVAFGAMPGGEIVDIRAKQIKDVLSDDEFTICVDVLNSTNALQEYDVELHHADGRRIDREPDTYEANVAPGAVREFCVGTNGTPLWSVSDLSDVVRVSIRADTPENFAFQDDMIIVDTADVRTR